MKTRRFVQTLCGLVIVAGCAWPSRAIAQAERASGCRIKIDTPRSGDKHGPDVLITGTARVPPGYFLYGFIHRRGLALWWPAGGGAASVNRERGDFAILATLGIPRDLGAEFELLLQAVDAAENAKLEQWFKQAEATGSYPGMPLPPFAEGCGVPPRVIVTKVR